MSSIEENNQFSKQSPVYWCGVMSKTLIEGVSASMGPRISPETNRILSDLLTDLVINKLWSPTDIPRLLPAILNIYFDPLLKNDEKEPAITRYLIDKNPVFSDRAASAICKAFAQAKESTGRSLAERFEGSSSEGIVFDTDGIQTDLYTKAIITDYIEAAKNVYINGVSDPSSLLREAHLTRRGLSNKRASSGGINPFH